MKTYKSDVSQAIHEMAVGLHRAEIIDEERMRRFDETCLLPSMSPEEIRTVREREQFTREDLARELHVSPDLVGRWKRGESTPSPPAMKFLDLVRRKGIDTLR